MTECKDNEQIQQAEDKLFNFRPLLFASIALVFGIYFAFLIKIKGVSAWWLLCLLPVLGAPFCFCRSKKRLIKTAIGICTLIISFAIGGGMFSAKVNSYTDTPTYNGEYTVIGRVISIEQGEETATLQLDNLYIDQKATKGALIAYLPASNTLNLRLSDEVYIKGYLQTRTALTTKNGFNAYKISDNIRFQLRADELTLVAEGSNPFLLAKDRLKRVLDEGMDETPAAVSFAVLTGDTTEIEGELLQNIRYGGIAHIFAVSGLHIGALFGFCGLLIKKTKLSTSPKIVRFVLTATVLLLYGGVCGYSASVIRAIVTCLIFYAFTLIGYGSDNLERIGAAAIVVLIVNPISLFEAGFQLSFSACLGIGLLSRPFRLAGMRLCKRAHLFPKRKSINSPPSIWESIVTACVSFLAVTLSAQIATTPISFVHFGYFSDWSLLLNCLFVPLVGVYFSALLVFSFIACILPISWSGAILFLPNIVWTLTLLPFEAVKFTASALVGIEFTTPAMVCYYSGLTFITDKWNLSKRQRVALFLLFELAFIACILIRLL